MPDDAAPIPLTPTTQAAEAATRAAFEWVRNECGHAPAILIALAEPPVWDRNALAAPILGGGGGMVAMLVRNHCSGEPELVVNLLLAAPRPMQLMARVAIPADVIQAAA